MLIVVAGVMEHDGCLLIGQRRAAMAHPLKWEFPGGKVEEGEEPAGALRRELEEELGIVADVGPEIARYEYQYPGRKPILLIFFKIDGYSGVLENRIFERIAWAARPSLASYDFLEGDTEFIRLLGSGV